MKSYALNMIKEKLPVVTATFRPSTLLLFESLAITVKIVENFLLSFNIACKNKIHDIEMILNKQSHS